MPAARTPTDVDGRDDDALVLASYAAVAVHIVNCSCVQLIVQLGASESFQAQIRTSDGCAIEGIVHTRVFENWPKDAVLNVVKA